MNLKRIKAWWTFRKIDKVKPNSVTLSERFDNAMSEVKKEKLMVFGTRKYTDDIIKEVIENHNYFYHPMETTWKDNDPAMNMEHEPFNPISTKITLDKSIVDKPVMEKIEEFNAAHIMNSPFIERCKSCYYFMNVAALNYCNKFRNNIWESKTFERHARFGTQCQHYQEILFVEPPKSVLKKIEELKQDISEEVEIPQEELFGAHEPLSGAEVAKGAYQDYLDTIEHTTNAMKEQGLGTPSAAQLEMIESMKMNGDVPVVSGDLSIEGPDTSLSEKAPPTSTQAQVLDGPIVRNGVYQYNGTQEVQDHPTHVITIKDIENIAPITERLTIANSIDVKELYIRFYALNKAEILGIFKITCFMGIHTIDNKWILFGNLVNLPEGINKFDIKEYLADITVPQFIETVHEIFSFGIPSDKFSVERYNPKNHEHFTYWECVRKKEVALPPLPKEFKVSELLTLKLELKNPHSSGILKPYDYETNIYVNNVMFKQCKYLLLNLDTSNRKLMKAQKQIESIDDAKELLSSEMESNHSIITPEEEFFGHCSNLQAWVEHNYDVNVLHSNLSFPLLKKLVQAGCKEAEMSFKEQVIERILKGKAKALIMLKDCLEYLDPDEIEMIVVDLLKHMDTEVITTFLQWDVLYLLSKEIRLRKTGTLYLKAKEALRRDGIDAQGFTFTEIDMEAELDEIFDLTEDEENEIFGDDDND